VNPDGYHIEKDDDDLDGAKARPVSRGRELSKKQSGYPDADDPLIPVRRYGLPVVEGVNGGAAGDDLKDHEEDVRGQVAAELDDRRLVVLVVQR
jgi:hypothetical protein